VYVHYNKFLNLVELVPLVYFANNPFCSFHLPNKDHQLTSSHQSMPFDGKRVSLTRKQTKSKKKTFWLYWLWVVFTNILMRSIYSQRSQNGKKTVKSSVSFFIFWDLRVKKLLIKCWYNQPLVSISSTLNSRILRSNVISAAFFLVTWM